MKVWFNYAFKLTFSEEVSHHAFCLRIVPQNNSIQQVNSWQLHINEKRDFSQSIDGFGNKLIFGAIQNPHKVFDVRILGEATLEAYMYKDNESPLMYLYPSTLIPFSPQIYTYLNTLILPSDPFAIAIFLNQTIYNNFQYLQGISTPTCDTDAFLSRRQGVCQDFSHLLIALLRLNAIPARYVNGFIDGQGETHAWVEAFIDGYWRGLDPTNGTLLYLSPYIKVAHGRDFFDARLNRGIFAGGGKQSIGVSVTVTKDEQ
ncbi:MAG: transglutaminase family protein [Campylobacteraceae bacterium]|nr:transglutaminase family protein [Campylobacteraceae bacterium]